MDSNSNKKQMDDPLQTITEEKIREAGGQITFERAFEYVCSEYVSKRIVWPSICEVRAEVDDNYGKYVTGFQPLKNGITRTFCSCPAEKQFCKHAAALGITWVQDPETFFNMESLPEMLKKKSRKELEELIMQIIYKRTECLTLLGIEGFAEDKKYDNDEWFDEDEYGY